MEFIILGAGSGLPNLEKNLSSLVIRTSDKNFLADCGDGTSRQLLRQGFNKDFLDAVFISHYHPDHIAGLYMVLQMLYLEGRIKPLDLFLPERADAFMDTLHMFYTFEQRFAFELKVHELKDAETIYPEVKAVLNDHLKGYAEVIKKNSYPNPMQAYSLAFQESDKTLVYTSDIGTLGSIESLLNSADMIVMDAFHPDPKQIISFIGKHKKHIILTHGITEKLAQWLQDNPQPNVELAVEDKIYQV
ncbi:MAG: ribonuclease Z [Candidatus Cloacimonadaceae bacterium]